MKRYVLGFLFNSAGTSVILCQHRKKTWQEKKWNGIGGHIEENESPIDAMARESKEEIGWHAVQWDNYCQMSMLAGWDVEVFRCFDDFFFKEAFQVEECTPIRRFRVEDLLRTPAGYRLPYPWSSFKEIPLIGNIPWLVAMALDPDNLQKATVIYKEDANYGKTKEDKTNKEDIEKEYEGFGLYGTKRVKG